MKEITKFYSDRMNNFPLNRPAGLYDPRRAPRNKSPRVPRVRGNSRGYALDRLNQHPELRSQVVSRRLSARKALILAGLRAPTVMVRTDDVGAAMRVLLKHFAGEDIVAGIENLKSGALTRSRSTSSLVVRGRSPLPAGGGVGSYTEATT